MRHVLCGLVAGALLAPAQPAAQFDAASIHRSQDCSGGRGGAGRGGMPVIGRFSVKCFTVQDYIEAAYSMFADGVSQNPRRMRIFGGPDWSQNETWDIEARAQSATPITQMYGPLLRTLLEDRFQLKIHRETRQLPVYALTVAKGGPKLTASKPGSCVPLDLNHLEPLAPGSVRCGSGSVRGNAARTVIDSHGKTMEALASGGFNVDLDRPVIDQTGLTGMFDIHLEFAFEGASAGDLSAPSLFTAVQEQLGLKLTPAQGPVEVLVIDRLERPSEN
ncbi:MAG TPA: TIGR03435 family protein [Bryobacteraceae bacterium]|nr:TIGR03435 family protein [Bryobacteraceae bacterium]